MFLLLASLCFGGYDLADGFGLGFVCGLLIGLFVLLGVGVWFRLWILFRGWVGVLRLLLIEGCVFCGFTLELLGWVIGFVFVLLWGGV